MKVREFKVRKIFQIKKITKLAKVTIQLYVYSEFTSESLVGRALNIIITMADSSILLCQFCQIMA